MPKNKSIKELRAEADASLDDTQRLIRDALYEKEPGDDVYVKDVYGEYLIFEKGGKCYKLSYSIIENKVTFGETETEVEQEWVALRSQQAQEESEKDNSFSLLMRMDQSNPEGTVWDVTVCEEGHTKNGWFITEESLKAVADEGLFENVDVNLFELPQGATHVPAQLFDIKSLLVKNKVGWLSDVRFAAGKVGKLVGKISFLDSAKWLGQNMLKAKQAGGKVYGLSYDAMTRAVQAVVDGKQVYKLTKFVRPDSLDIVTRPAAGGSFNRAIAARPLQEEKSIMNKEQLWALILEKRPDLLAGRTLAGITDEEVTTLARMAMEPKKVEAVDNSAQVAAMQAQNDEVKKIRCEMALRDALSTSDLPDVTQQRIKKEFKDRIFDAAELTSTITREKEYLSQMAEKFKTEASDYVPSGAVIHVGMGSIERATMALDRMFGLTKEQVTNFATSRNVDGKPQFSDVRSVQDCGSYDEIPAFSGLREAYVFFTGDKDITGRIVRKNLPAELRGMADVTSSTFTYALANTMHRRIVAVYRLADYGEQLLVSTKKAVKDFRTQEAINVGYFSDIDTVNPETADYDEITAVTDEEATYTIGQKGNILSVTRKMIINDDVTLVGKLLDRLGRATRRTHAKFVWNFWINNSNCADGTAWHTSGHGNLGSTALSHSTFNTGWIALAKMTEKDSGERICLLDDPSVQVVLIHPPDVNPTARTIAEAEFYHTGADDRTTKIVNPYRGRVQRRQLSLLTDTDNWGMIIPSQFGVDHLEVGYLNGREEPEFFVADSPQSEQVFVADKIRHKVRHEYGGTPVDPRGSYKAEV